VFERLYQILVDHNAWREAEAAVRRMIARVESARGAQQVPALESLWRLLGDIYRQTLGDPASAARAYQMCARLAPHSPVYPKLLAQIARS
jgi:cytochrome c-type biogenesis protein CcmH/NrfG